jgi:twitching motility two-component system response regulator PilG
MFSTQIILPCLGLSTQRLVMSRVFKIGIFGLTSYEHNALSSIFKLATARERCYHLISSKAREKADIILVDNDDPKAISEWHQFNAQHSKIPTIQVTKVISETITEDIRLYRPLTLVRVITTLDEVTINVLKVTLVTIDDHQIIDEVTRSLLEGVIQACQLDVNAYRALVVDDALAVRKAMEIQLGIFGMRVDFAETGEEALEYVNKQNYDIIFLDLMLPGIDGYKVCKMIKADKMTKNIPIILLTSKSGYFNKLRGILAGASVYLTKPLQQEQLKTVIQQVLPQKQIR